MNLPDIANSHFRYYAAAADTLGVQWKVLLSGKVMELRKGEKRYYLYRAATPLNMQSHVRVSKSKWVVAELLRPQGISVPTQARIRTIDELQSFYAKHGSIVVKPVNSHGGKGISILPDQSNLQSAFDYAFAARENDYILAEPFYQGNNYRIVMLDGRLLAVVWRKLPQVTGDGVSTVAQLVQKRNDSRKDTNESAIPQDGEFAHTLKLFKVEPSTVLQKGVVQPVRLTANVSKGGTTVDVTDHVAPEFVTMATQVADILQLRLVAVDLITPNISSFGTYVVNEVNVSPGLRIHYQPSEGPVREIAVPIIEAIFK